MEFRLKELCELKGVSLLDISHESGISYNSLRKYANGLIPRVVIIEQIAKAYDVDPSWLIGWNNENNVQVIEKETVKEVIKEVTKEPSLLPPYWNNDNEGRLIRWKNRRRYL